MGLFNFCVRSSPMLAYEKVDKNNAPDVSSNPRPRHEPWHPSNQGNRTRSTPRTGDKRRGSSKQSNRTACKRPQIQTLDEMVYTSGPLMAAVRAMLRCLLRVLIMHRALLLDWCRLVSSVPSVRGCYRSRRWALATSKWHVAGKNSALW